MHLEEFCIQGVSKEEGSAGPDSRFLGIEIGTELRGRPPIADGLPVLSDSWIQAKSR